MVQTYIRPTDIAVLKHKHVHRVTRHGIDFIELRHPATKRHKNHMLGTELALNRYQSILRRPGRKGVPAQDDYLFLPEMANRDSALDALATQFTALLEMTNLRQDAEGKPRTLYSLRHTAIVRSIQKGLPLEMIAANSRTSSEMIRRFYGSHVKSVLYMGSHFVDKEKSIRDERYSTVNALAKEIGFEFDAYEEDKEAEIEKMADVADAEVRVTVKERRGRVKAE